MGDQHPHLLGWSATSSSPTRPPPLLPSTYAGSADGGGFAPIRDLLADRYTVVTYDPRGLSRSPFDGEPQDTTVQNLRRRRASAARKTGRRPGTNRWLRQNLVRRTEPREHLGVHENALDDARPRRVSTLSTAEV